jgi:glutaredoxin 2
MYEECNKNVRVMLLAGMRNLSNDRKGDETTATRLIHHTVIPIKLNPHGLLRGLIRSDWCQYTCNQLDKSSAIVSRGEIKCVMHNE